MFIDSVQKYLGELYSIKTIDGEPVIYRELDGFEFEVSGVHSANAPYNLYVWKKCPRELVGIYSGIKGIDVLKDILGYYATKYQNLISGIQVEREE